MVVSINYNCQNSTYDIFSECECIFYSHSFLQIEDWLKDKNFKQTDNLSIWVNESD